MYVLRIGDEKYKIQYKYRTLWETDIIDKVVGLGSSLDKDNPAGMLKNIIGITAEMLLVGLQANHSSEFGYSDAEEYKQRMGDVMDLMDEYEAENIGEDGIPTKDGFTLFQELQGELERNGFLSAMRGNAQQTAAEQNATVVPLDHKRKTKAGEKK